MGGTPGNADGCENIGSYGRALRMVVKTKDMRDRRRQCRCGVGLGQWEAFSVVCAMVRRRVILKGLREPCAARRFRKWLKR